MTDEVEQAAQLWQDGAISRFDFAIVAASVVGKRDGGTERLAAKIRHEVDTVEEYAKGGILWVAMLKVYPSDSEILRDALEISFWNVIGRVFARRAKGLKAQLDAGEITQDEHDKRLAHALRIAKDQLYEVDKKRWTVEKLRSFVPSDADEESGTSPFTRAMKRLNKTISKNILNAPALNSGMTDKEYKRLLRVAGMMLKITERYTA